MTRILVLTNLYPPHDYGGYEQSCADVMSRLARRGHQIVVLTSRHRRPGRLTPASGEPGPEVIRALEIYWEDQTLVTPPRLTRLRWELRNQRRLERVMRGFRPEVASVWNMGAMSFGLLERLRRSGVPVVYAICNDWLVWGPDQDPWMKGLSDRPHLARVLSRLTGIPTGLGDLGSGGTFLFVSDWTRRYALEHSRWSFPDSAVVYSGIESGDFAPQVGAGPRGQAGAPDPPPAGSEEWGWRLLFVGRLDPDKGPLTALEALARLPPGATLEIIGPGSGSQRRALEEAAVRLGVADRVRLAEVPRAELGPSYRRADVFVFPSRWEEPFGLTPLEAMACGTPVVGTGSGGSGEFLRDGVNCLRVPREDPEAMAAAVRRLARDPELRRRLVANGRRTAAELTTDNLSETFEAWLVAAAEGFRHGRPPDRRLPGAEERENRKSPLR